MQKHFAVVTGITMLVVAGFVAYQQQGRDVRGFVGNGDMVSTTSKSILSSTTTTQSSAKNIDYDYLCVAARDSALMDCLFEYQIDIDTCFDENEGQPANSKLCAENARKKFSDCRDETNVKKDQCLKNKQLSCRSDDECSFHIKGKCENSVCKF